MRHKKIQLALIYFSVVFGLIYLHAFDPAASNTIYPPSLSREWGGFYCGGCGMLRALHQLLHGNWQAALRFNPLLIICLPYFFYWIAPYLLKYFYRIDLYRIKYKQQQIVLIATISLIYGALRNTTIPALTWLVPPS
jgi:Protein of unknown function (DUF2752)